VISHISILYRSKCRDFPFSTGNKGVEQLVIKFFSKCGIPLILFSLILALLCMAGCLEKTPELSVAPSEFSVASSAVSQNQPAMQMDFDVELRSDLFGVRGNIMLPGNSSLAYLMLNATLRQGEKLQFSTKYLMMQIDPNRDYSFEISKNVKIPAGEYDCSLEAKGPQGVLAEESRKVSLVSRQEPRFELIPWPVELDEEVLGQENEEVQSKEESAVQREYSNDAAADAAAEEDSVVTASKQGASASGEVSLQKSSALSKVNGTLMGSITSKKYHHLDCRYALKIKPENRIYFESVEDAKEQGYLPCKICNP